MAEELSEKRWKRPKTRNDLIERLMKYDWGVQMGILNYMRQFNTWAELWADLEFRETGRRPLQPHVELLGTKPDVIIIEDVPNQTHGIAGNTSFEWKPRALKSIKIEVQRKHPDVEEMRNVTPKPECSVAESLDRIEEILAEPEPEECPDCRDAKRHAYSDATTPGFFYMTCSKHRSMEGK